MRREYINIGTLFVTILYLIPIAFCNDAALIPPNKGQVESWFKQNVQPLSARKGTIDKALQAAESNVTYIRMKADGSGDFKTLNAAIKSIPTGNTKRVVIMLGGGTYTEKVIIDTMRPFITLYGDPNSVPTLAYHGTAKQYGTVYSATLIVYADYFSAVNVKFANTAPRPNGKTSVGDQALALRLGGNKASLYNCKLYGYQDTLCDDKGLHFFKDCYFGGTVDFVFGGAKSLYLNTELHVIPGDPMAVITAQARNGKDQDLGFSFVHCKVTGGTGKGNDGLAYLGRAWSRYPNVVYAYGEMANVVHKEGWFNNRNNANNGTVSFGEYKNVGPGADLTGRARFTTKLTDAQAKPYLSLGFILGSSWLLPPTSGKKRLSI